MIFTHHEKPDIAQRSGIPLLTSRAVRDPAILRMHIHGVDGREARPYCSKCVNMLHIDLDSVLNSRRAPSEMVDASGRGPMRSDLDAGPILVVRRDGQPLHPLHLQVTCCYYAEVMEDIIQARDEVDDELRYAYVMDKISKESFMELFGRDA